MNELVSKFFKLLITSALLAFVLYLWFPRLNIVISQDEVVEIKDKTDMMLNEGSWATLSYDYCFSAQYYDSHFFEDDRGFGVFKIANTDEDEFVICTTPKRIDTAMMNNPNFIQHTNRIPKTEPATIKGYIVKLREEETETLREKAESSTDDYKFINEEDQTEYEYALQIKDPEKEKKLLIGCAGLLFLALIFWGLSLRNFLQGCQNSFK